METILTKQDILELFQRDRIELIERQKIYEEERKRSQKINEEERKKSRAEFDLRLKKFDKRMNDIGKKIANLTDSWSDFVEGMVRPNLIDLFLKRDIIFERIYPNIKEKRNNQLFYEIDLLVVNSEYILAVEIKTKLNTQGVKNHLERLEKIQEQPPRDFKKGFEGKILIGAIAGMKSDEEAEKYAQRKGLFVLRPKGENMEIINNKQFLHKKWLLQ